MVVREVTSSFSTRATFFSAMSSTMFSIIRWWNRHTSLQAWRIRP